jgi:hypothetical protein
VLPARSLVFSVWRCRANPLELKAPTGYPGNRDFATGNQGRSVTDSVAVTAFPFLRGCKSGSGEPVRRRTAEHRDRALVGLTGQVLEIGAGTPIMVGRRGSGWAVA